MSFPFLNQPTSRQILVFGSYNQDLSWSSPYFPELGETVAGKFLMGPGGKGSNQAIAAHKSGGNILFVGAVGNDTFGELAKSHLKDQGLSFSLISKPEQTGTAGIFVDGTGQNKIIVHLGANALLKSEDVSDELLKTTGWLVAPLEGDIAEVEKLFLRAKTFNVITILNPAPNHTLLPVPLLKSVDIIIPNESEFISLILQIEPKLDPKQLKIALEDLDLIPLHQACRLLGIPYVIVTLGEKGVFLSDPKNYYFFPAIKVPVVDTTGAGDTFVGALTTALSSEKESIATAIQFAIAAAALTVTKPGASQSMPTKNEIEKLLLN